MSAVLFCTVLAGRSFQFCGGRLWLGGSLLSFSFFCLQTLHAPFVPEEQVAPSLKVFLENDTYSLGGQIGARIVPIIGFVIGLQSDVA